jgi:CRP-like cAMP-binding protein
MAEEAGQEMESLTREECAERLVESVTKCHSENVDDAAQDDGLAAITGQCKPNGWVNHTASLLHQLNCNPFRRLELPTLRLIARRLRLEHPAESQVIASAGTQPSRLIIVLRGNVKANKPTQHLGPADCVINHQKLANGIPLEQTFVCNKHDTILLTLHASAYSHALKLRSLTIVSEMQAFKQLPANLWRSLLLRLELFTFNAGDTVFNEGDIGEHLYIVLSGSVGVFIRQHFEILSAIEDSEGAGNRDLADQSCDIRSSSEGKIGHSSREEEVRTLQEGSTFGELALTTNEPRSATVVCKDFSEMVTLDRHAYSMLTTAAGMASGFNKSFTADQAQKALEVLSMPPDKRPEKEVLRLADGLAAINFFRKLSFYVRADMCRVLRHEHFSANDTLFVQGDEGDRMFIIFSGKVDIVSKKDTGHSEHLTTLTAGSAFGELAILRRAPRSATAITREECHMASLDADKYDSTLHREHLRTLSQYTDFVSCVGMLKGASRSVQLKWAHQMESIELSRGSVLLKQGKTPSQIYLIQAGECEMQYSYYSGMGHSYSHAASKSVSRQAPPKVLRVAIIGSKEYAGIDACVLGKPCATSVIARTSIKCYSIPANDFLRALSRREMQRLTERCRERDEMILSRLSNSVTTLANVVSASARDYQRAVSPEEVSVAAKAGGRSGRTSSTRARSERPSLSGPQSTSSRFLTTSEREGIRSGWRNAQSENTQLAARSKTLNSNSWPDVGKQGIEIGLQKANSRLLGSQSERPHAAMAESSVQKLKISEALNVP